MKFLIKNGFTMIEVIVAIAIITAGLVGCLILVGKSTASISASKNKFIASNLIQEGIEVVRNIRDTNWLEGDDWDDGLGTATSSCDTFTDWEIDYDDTTLTDSYDGDYLKIDGDDYYQYDSGNNTIFKRKVSLCYESGCEIKVVSTVYFTDHGRDYTVSAEEKIFNWK